MRLPTQHPQVATAADPSTGTIQWLIALQPPLDHANTSWQLQTLPCTNSQLAATSWNQELSELLLTLHITNLAAPIECDGPILLTDQDGIRYLAPFTTAQIPEPARILRGLGPLVPVLAQDWALNIIGTYKGLCPPGEIFHLEARRCQK